MMQRRWTLLYVVLGLLLAASLAASVYSYNYFRNYFSNQLISIAEIIVRPAPTTVATVDPSDVKLPSAWNGKERLNILVMGIDQRQGEKDVGYRTDTMIVITVDPVAMQAGMLSVPRDLWVPIPTFGGNQRINFANQWGDANDYPGGGANLARKTIESVLGIRIHHFARVNFTVFEAFVDRVGGIEIDVPDEIYDKEYPTSDFGTEIFQLSKGKQMLDGATALKYARTRHDKNGDFGRARRQQQVILAIKEKLKEPRVLASLLASAPDLIAELGASIKTDLNLNQIQQLAVLAQHIPREQIRNAVLDQGYTEFATTPDGSQVLIARRDKIAELRDTFFSSAPSSATPTN
jgi:LCP family protein required for cell wall assembly